MLKGSTVVPTRTLGHGSNYFEILSLLTKRGTTFDKPTHDVFVTEVLWLRKKSLHLRIQLKTKSYLIALQEINKNQQY